MKLFRKIIPFSVFILCILFFAASSLNANIHTVSTKLNDEIDIQLQKKISKTKNAFFEGVKKKNYDEVLSLISPKLSELENFNLKSFVDQLSPLLNNSKFVVFDQYYSTINTIGKESKATIIPSLSDKDKFIINNLTFYGKESYNLFLKNNNPGWQHLLFMSLSKFNEQWKINIIHVGDLSISYLTIPKLYRMSKDAKAQKRLTSASLYLLVMNRFLRPAPYLQYMDEHKYTDFMKKTFKEMNTKMKFPFMVAGVNVIGINYTTTNNEGIIPVILYITDKNLKEQNLVEEEAKQLKDDFIKKLYGIDQDFNYFIMKAHNEMPSDPKKTYDAYNTVINLTE